MVKIGVFSDTHVGKSTPTNIGDLRRQAYRHAFTEAINIFIQEGVDCVIHAGDLFEKKSMTPEDSVFVKNELQRLVDSIRDKSGSGPPVFLLRGNHDGSPESNTLGYVEHPLARYLKPFGDRTLRGEAEYYDVGDIRVVGISYHTYIGTKYNEIEPAVVKSFADRNGPNIVVVHNFIRGYHNIPDGVPEHNTYTLDDFADLPVQLVISGHYHSKLVPMRTKDKHFLSSCATEAEDLSDEGEHGVWIVDENLTPRFEPITPLHQIRSIQVGKEDATEPLDWFVESALTEVKSYANLLQQTSSKGIIRIVLSGNTDGEPYVIERLLEPKLAKMKQANPRLIHYELVNNVQPIHRTVQLPAAATSGIDYAAKVLEPLGELQLEGTKLTEEIQLALDERASEKTQQLTPSDRHPFIQRWIELLEETEGKTS
jgi:DNA repair exonuclease SbcCD nuclease subunit